MAFRNKIESRGQAVHLCIPSSYTAQHSTRILPLIVGQTLFYADCTEPYKLAAKHPQIERNRKLGPRGESSELSLV